MIDDRTELLGMTRNDMENYLLTLGEPAYKGRQIHQWIYHKSVHDFSEMSNLTKELRNKLKRSTVVSMPVTILQRLSNDGTIKLLVEFIDEQRIETVIIPQKHTPAMNYTLCISTQVGCPVGCSFCATGKTGFVRNLKANEIAGQFLTSRKAICAFTGREDSNIIGNVVYMGMGEPMLNYKEVIKSIYILNDPVGINMGQRNITISTCGDVKGINRLAEEKLQVTLAISLHACDNRLRNELVPLNRKYPLEKLMRAVNNYIQVTNRRTTFEYLLLDGVNNSKRDAVNIIAMLKPLLANVNLIPYNEVEGLSFRKPSRARIEQFYQWLVDGGLNVTVRQERGADIEAACGQLRAVSK